MVRLAIGDITNENVVLVGTVSELSTYARAYMAMLQEGRLTDSDRWRFAAKAK